MSSQNWLSHFEYNDLTAQESAMIRQRLPPYILPTAITRVRNPRVRRLYQQNKKSYRSCYGEDYELSLWHATSEENVAKIASKNFNYRLAERSRFGYGVCFSTDPGYSNFHCNKACDDRALILCNVLVGHTTRGHRGLRDLPDGCDSAVGAGGLVYVKFDDHEFYPAYVVYFSNRYYKGDKTTYNPVPVNMP